MSLWRKALYTFPLLVVWGSVLVPRAFAYPIDFSSRPEVYNVSVSLSTTTPYNIYDLNFTTSYVCTDGQNFRSWASSTAILSGAYDGVGGLLSTICGQTINIGQPDVDAYMGSSGATGNLYFVYRSSLSTTDPNSVVWYTAFPVTGGVLASSPGGDVTRIISIYPAGGSTVASSSFPIILNATGFVTEDDYDDDVYIRWSYNDIACGMSGVGSFDTGCLFTQNRVDPASGFFDVDSATSSSYKRIGRQEFTVSIRDPHLFGLYDSVLYSTSTYFIVGTSSAFDNLHDQVLGDFNEILGSASSTISLGEVCNPLSGFDVVSCMLVLFVPSQTEISGFVSSLRERVLSSFPLGYVTDFVEIISATSTVPLVVFNASIPQPLPGHGASLTLDISHSLDYILNATSGVFSTGSASSSETFYEITDYYWRIIVYVGLALYLLRRILGSHLIPHL